MPISPKKICQIYRIIVRNYQWLLKKSINIISLQHTHYSLSCQTIYQPFNFLIYNTSKFNEYSIDRGIDLFDGDRLHNDIRIT